MLRARSRPLTEAEIALASQLFRDAIDYRRVRVHGRRYLPFQPKNCCMTPNGSMYFHHSCFLPDYTRGDPGAIHWFMHELVHVWQHQLGYPVRLRGAIRFGLPYAYSLHAGARLADYNMEAQGDLLADYFVLKFLRKPDAMRQGQHRGSLALYEAVLAGFLADPSDPRSLPSGPAAWLARPRRIAA
ncbi:Rhs element Vgr protein [Massilia sp. MS-15]|uniref:Rhs element Vgr protein n=1 Tax=Massilia sp. MS-15 TaxID=2878200 RepID=UPI001CD527A5|nr:Rhs element Vgr protein [Massilia sp. MS-15]MCA1245375.1 Rhs element Vgr protein [Massilia sp. MS-15]